MDKKEARALKRENEYLKAKNAYLESLLESLGYESEKLKILYKRKEKKPYM